MKITLLQTSICWCRAEANQAKAEQMMNANTDTDLFVLPEMWATGFCMNPTPGLQRASTSSLEWMLRQAAQRGCAVAGSLPVCEGGNEKSFIDKCWYNRFYFVYPDGTYEYYDKRNLFTYAGEHRAYAEGQRSVIVSWRGVRFMLQVCFDLRFPETARNTAANPYDVLLYVANWPSVRRPAWDVLLPARAVENQCYAIGVNRTGTDPQCVYNGGTIVADFLGRVLYQLDEQVQAVTFEPDLESLQRQRIHFPVLR